MRDDELYSVLSKIEPDDSLQNRILDRIEGKRMKKSTIKHTGKIIAVAAALVAALATTAFAMTPTGQETISSIIAYFQNDKATEMTSLEELSLYNEEIGKSFTKDGYTLTLDNVAADDNFIHVFYTIKSDTVPFYEGDDARAMMMFNDAARKPQMEVEIAINGEMAGWHFNHNTIDGYFVDNYTYKSAAKFNVAGVDIPDIFKVELFGEVLYPDGELSETYLKLFKNDGYVDMTGEDIASIWYVSADVDKSKVKVATVSKDINAKLTWMDGTLEKVIFSPFGNQLVMSTPSNNYDEYFRIDQFALFDENDKALDVINTDLGGSTDGSSRNSLEFLKADKDTSKLKLVPMKFNEHGDCDDIVLPVGEYPLTYKLNNYGSVVVTDIRISDGQVEIDYYKDGFVMYDPGFRPLNDNGEIVEPGGKLGCVLYHDVHYDTNSYTARYVYDACDENGKPIPMGEECKAENLKKTITKLGVIEQMYVELDYDNALTVDLK